MSEIIDLWQAMQLSEYARDAYIKRLTPVEVEEVRKLWIEDFCAIICGLPKAES